MQVGHVVPLAQGVVPQFIGRTVHVTPFQSRSGQPDGETVRVMIAAGRGPAPFLPPRSPSKLGAKDHRHVVHQPSLLQIGQEPGDRLINRLAHPRMVLLQLLVRIPRAIWRGKDLDKSNASLDHPPGHQHSLARHLRRPLVDAIQPLGIGGLLVQ